MKRYPFVFVFVFVFITLFLSGRFLLRDLDFENTFGVSALNFLIGFLLITYPPLIILYVKNRKSIQVKD